jgi:hypothetical protein
LCTYILVLEIGPSLKSVLRYLPSCLRQKVRRYAAFKLNSLFATRLEEWLCSTLETESLLPYLESLLNIYQIPFVLDSNTGSGTSTSTSDSNEKFNVILFCYSMYSIKPKHRFIEQALEMLVKQLEGRIVVVFYYNKTLYLDSLICY